MIRIKNNGELETAGLTLIGASSKDGKDLIGFFGSGNKYALAVLLRNHIEFHIYSGTREVMVDTKEVKFNGEVYYQIWVDGEPTSMTTRMGPNWELWFALREIVSNARDEGGFEMCEVDEMDPQVGETTIFLDAEPFRNILDNMDQYFADDVEVLDEVKTRYGIVRIMEPKSECTNMYRKGISVYPSNNDNALFWYDVERIDINEARTYQYDFQVREAMADAIAGTHSLDVIQQFAGRPDESTEASLVMRGVYSVSNEWIEYLKGKTVYPQSMARMYPPEDVMRGVVLPTEFARRIADETDAIRVVGFGKQKYEEVEITEAQEDIIKDAMYNLMLLGYPVTTTIKYVMVAEESTVAWYNVDDEVVYICTQYIRDVDSMMSILFEEQTHASGYSDGSRAFEQYLIDELLRRAKEAKGVL